MKITIEKESNVKSETGRLVSGMKSVHLQIHFGQNSRENKLSQICVRRNN